MFCNTETGEKTHLDPRQFTLWPNKMAELKKHATRPDGYLELTAKELSEGLAPTGVMIEMIDLI
jgi:hypothetical protein